MPTLAWSPYFDPFEGGFTIEVPTGWLIYGGIIRYEIEHPAILLCAEAPDHKTYFQLGTPEPSVYQTPTFGQPESGRALRYQTGLEYARGYSRRAIAPRYPDFVVTVERERPDLTQGPWASANPQCPHRGGEVRFTCTRSGEPAEGSAAADTYLVPTLPMFSGLWGIDFFAAMIVPLGQIEAKLPQIRQMIASVKFNPAWWQQMQATKQEAARGYMANAQRLTAAAAQARGHLQQFADFAAAQRERAALRQNQVDAAQAAFGETISGFSTYQDAAGNQRFLDNTKVHWWSGPNGRTVSTDGPLSPGPDWQPMTRIKL